MRGGGNAPANAGFVLRRREGRKFFLRILCAAGGTEILSILRTRLWAEFFLDFARAGLGGDKFCAHVRLRFNVRLRFIKYRLKMDDGTRRGMRVFGRL